MGYVDFVVIYLFAYYRRVATKSVSNRPAVRLRVLIHEAS